jgi:hypothetical protein
MQGESMDNLQIDSHDLDEQNLFSRLMENQKVRLAAALMLGLIVGSGGTWAAMKTDAPKKSKAAVIEPSRVENRVSPVQTSSTASKPASTKKVSLKVALKECNKITNKKKREACMVRTKKAYASRTNSTAKRTNTTTKRTSSSVKPARTTTS